MSAAPGFDAEPYLRLAGERTLLGQGEGARWGSPVTGAARALVAAGVIDAETATEVAEEHLLAMALREPGGPAAVMRGARGRRVRAAAGRAGAAGRAAPPALTPWRVVTCDRSFAVGALRLRVTSVRLGENAASVGGAVSGSPPHGGPPSVTLADDRGTTVTAHFSGGGNREWRGSYTSAAPLRRDTAWIEIDGERIELAGPPARSAEVSVRRCPSRIRRCGTCGAGSRCRSTAPEEACSTWRSTRSSPPASSLPMRLSSPTFARSNRRCVAGGSRARRRGCRRPPRPRGAAARSPSRGDQCCRGAA